PVDRWPHQVKKRLKTQYSTDEWGRPNDGMDMVDRPWLLTMTKGRQENNEANTDGRIGMSWKEALGREGGGGGAGAGWPGAAQAAMAAH
ncbi:hypothetical protein M5D96_006454, partial [Drosophila gunungcola]